jgi:hypothetical protein
MPKTVPARKDDSDAEDSVLARKEDPKMPKSSKKKIVDDLVVQNTLLMMSPSISTLVEDENRRSPLLCHCE